MKMKVSKRKATIGLISAIGLALIAYGVELPAWLMNLIIQMSGG